MKGCVCVPVRTPWRVVSEGVCVCVPVRTPWRVVSEGGVCVCLRVVSEGVCVCACQDAMESC